MKKKVESAFIQFSLMLDEEVTDVVKEVLVGEKVELGCRVNNKLLHEIGADKVEIVFVSKEDSKVKFRIGVHTEGTEQVTLKPGNDNVFTFSGASPSAGTFSLNSLAITAGKLTIKRPYRGEQNVTVTVATTPPSATFVATFPSKQTNTHSRMTTPLLTDCINTEWMPKDKEQQPYNVNFIIKANKDKLSNISLELNTDAIFRVANLTGPNGKEFPVEKGNVVNLGETIECGEDVVLSAPIDYDKLRKTNKVSAKLVFQTALSGGACCLSQAVTVRCSDPFTFTFWQAAFKGNSVLVQIQLQSKATVPLRVLACKIAPAAGKTALEGTIYSLGTKGQPFETVYRVADGFADVEEDDSSVVMPGHVFGTAYVFQKPPKFTETWNFSVKYEFEPFSTKKQPSPPAASGVDALIRTFTSPFNMGFFSPEYTATLSFPQAVTVGEMFNMVIRVTPSLSQQYHQQYPSASTEPEEKEKCNEEKKRAKKVMMLRVSLPAPEQFVQQGYSSRVIEFMDGDNREQTFRVGFIPLQMGELLVPTVEITDVDSEFNKARILSEHPVVLSLSSKQYFMSCESQTAPRPPGNSVASSTSKRSVEPFYVLWVHTPAGAEAAKDKDCTQVIKSAVAKLKQQVALDITHYTYTEWLRCRAQAMEEKTFRKIIVDGDSRLASRVLLYTKQREKYTDTPIVILTEDTIKSWSEFSQLSNVRTIHNYDQLFETLVENPFIASSGQGTASTDIASTQGSSMPTSDGGKAKGSSGGHRLTKSSSFPIKPSKKN